MKPNGKFAPTENTTERKATIPNKGSGFFIPNAIIPINRKISKMKDASLISDNKPIQGYESDPGDTTLKPSIVSTCMMLVLEDSLTKYCSRKSCEYEAGVPNMGDK